MLEVFDYSNRRGVIVPMLDSIYSVITEYAANEKLACLPPLPNKIIWKQRMGKELIQINTRWLFALDGASLAGLMFFRFPDNGQGQGNEAKVYIDELIVAYPYRHNGLVFPMLCDKFLREDSVKKCSCVFAGERIKREENKELLYSVGFKEDYPGGYTPLGTPEEAADGLRLRYMRKS